jgi:hypothetical protein
MSAERTFQFTPVRPLLFQPNKKINRSFFIQPHLIQVHPFHTPIKFIIQKIHYQMTKYQESKINMYRSTQQVCNNKSAIIAFALSVSLLK